MDNTENDIERLIDDFDFKPITDGLGFHHSIQNKKDVKVNLKKQSMDLQSELEQRISHMTAQKSENQSSVNMGELAPFYGDSKEEKEAEVSTQVKLFSEEEKSPNYYMAQNSERFLAWVIDITLIVTTMLFTFSSIIYFANIPLSQVSLFAASSEVLVSFLLLSVMFYVFYFSFLDKTHYSTLGKHLVGIRIVSHRGHDEVSLLQSLLRVSICLFSIFLLGLPVMLKMHDRLTETDVIKK
ncbi:MAG: RDD family protein [Bacteriovoracaceae bacterium]|jgi:uncharacterized RDD family membrane protein YckC|nr:hypothetical protein [Halobacteriovoraceae bacterium]MDP7321258.1 RDD family protein [Bacteriovoracaceae bacterium]|tara:strand:+ start:461 stop:1180 length:720 start_codon:yes stop_codon:yes gene_type:complete